jgi:hypothetical protein
MFLMAALSALAVSLTFLSNTETASTRNYKTMSQARYGGEAGVHAAINYLTQSYTAPASPFIGYDTAKSPVTCTIGCTHNTVTTCDASSAQTAVNTGCVVLSTLSGIDSNYPDAAVRTAYSTAAQGTLATNASGTTTNAAMGTVNYAAAAILLNMYQMTVYGGAKVVVQTWQIVGDGTVPGAIPATVEVTATLERGPTAAVKEAVFASDSGCGAITMAGNEVTDSYDSSAALSGGKPVISASGGSVGTNGNLDIGGNVTIHGVLDTPKTGVGSCTAGNVTAESVTGAQATVDQGYVSLPQTRTLPDPAAPNPMPGTTSLSITSSMTLLTLNAALTGSNALATLTGSGFKITPLVAGSPMVLPNLTVSGNLTLTIGGGSNVNVNVNSVKLSGGATLALDSSPATSVVMNLAGQGIDSSGTVLDFTGGSLSTGSYDPSTFQILYAGTSNLKMTGNASSAALVYAPDATFTMSGTTDFYGAIISSKFRDTGGATVHYDRRLSSTLPTVSNYALTGFTWKKY